MVVIARTEAILHTARLGLEDVKGNDARRRIAGIHNVATFGRAVTNVLQNLRSIATGFDAWYQPKVAEMAGDPLMRFFYTVRSEILKQGAVTVSSGVQFSGNLMEMMKRFEPPPRAKGFFIADYIGGSGWKVETTDGTTEKYYVELPTDLPGLCLDIKKRTSATHPAIYGIFLRLYSVNVTSTTLMPW